MSIKIEYDEDSGLWEIYVFIKGAWFHIAGECEKEDSDEIVKTLTLWKAEQPNAKTKKKT